MLTCLSWMYMVCASAILTNLKIENVMAIRTVAEKDLRKNIFEKFPVITLRTLVSVPAI